MNRTMAVGLQFTWIGLLSLLLTSCEVQPQKPQHPGEILTLRVEIHGDYADRLAQQHQTPVIRFWMQPVVGSIYGRPAEGRFADARVEGSGKFGVSLDGIESALARAARIADSRSLTYFPAETRIARLAAVSSLWSDPDRNYDTTLRDARSGQLLILIYVDRPCQIRGALGDNSVDLSLERRGLYWLEMTHTSTRKAEAARLVTVPPEVIVRLDPL